MNEKRFDFGVDIPTKITKYTKRFTDLEGFLDEDYDGEHHMLWDNQDECWICLDDVLCLMEKEYVNIKKENEELKSIKRFAENNGINIFHIDTAFRNCWKDNANLVTKIRKQEDEISYWKHKVSSLLWILGQFDEQKVKKLLEELDDNHIPRVGDLLDELQTKCHRLEKENDNCKNDYRELFSNYVALEEKNEQLRKENEAWKKRE